MRRWWPLAVLLAGIGCHRGERASAEECAQIFDRIVELELNERGFRDPALLDRKRQELRRTFFRELKECEGKKLVPGALDCARQAPSAEVISHVCLR